MDKNNNNTFENTVNWAANKTTKVVKTTKGGIPLFYLIIGAVVILILLILIAYFVGKESDEKDELDLLMEEDNQNDQSEVNSEVNDSLHFDDRKEINDINDAIDSMIQQDN